MAEVLRLPENECKRTAQTVRQKAIKFGRTLVGKKAVISKAIVDSWHKRKGRKVRPVEQIDGGFFERYGSGFKDNFEEDTIIAEKDIFATLNEREISRVDNDIAERTHLSYKQLLSSLLELNINELYEEVLHEILHCIGVEKSCLNQENIIEFARKAFKIDQDTHDAIYKAVIEKEAPSIMLNIEIIEGKDIKPKDANGFSDPFCTLFLSSTQQHRYNTSVKSQTLRPVWEEHFSLPVETPDDDILCVEVWDFDPAETVKEKVTKVGDIKGFKGMRRFMKEIAVTATNGKHDNEIIGVTLIPLKTIPSRGQIAWYSLEKKGKGKPQGNLLLKLSFGSEKNKQVAAQEHRHLLRVLLAYQMNAQKPEMNSWKGDFLPESSLIIQQHVAQSNIGAVDECLSQWIEYINAHVLSPVVNFKVFSDILDILVKPITTGHLSNEELKMFWQSSKKILPFCFNAIRTIRKKSAEDEQLLNQIEYVLNILRNLTFLELPNDLDLFPSDIYGWLLPCEHTRDIKSTLHDAVVHGAVDWHVHILENNKPDDFTDEGQMKLQLKIIQLLKLDLQRAIEFHDKLFIKKMQFPYVSTLFSIYEIKISEMCEPFITRICMNMKPINFEENGRFQVDNDPLAMGTSLFELYMGIQKFVDLGKNNCNVDFETNSHLVKYHLWFQQGVARWLDIAAYKAMQRIERAVELDKLVKVDTSVEYSSSAVDTLAIFYQIKVFWQQLAWPDAEGSYSFVAKIIDDICRCSVYFSDKTAYKVNNTVIENKRFEVTKEWCLAVNNIDYVKQSIRPFVNDLGITKLMDSLANYKSEISADHCKKTLDLVVDNAIDTVNNKIIDLLQTVVNKMSPEISKFLMEGAEVINTNNTHLDNLMLYLDENLCTLSKELNEENFQRILDIIVDQIATIMYNLIQNNLEKKPPTYFRNLRDSFHMLFGFLRKDNNTEYKSETIQKLEALLHLHTLDTVNLIHEYYLERLQKQKEMQDANEGVLTVKLIFINNVLKVDILNANGIKAMDSNGFSDPFIKVRLLPKDKFQHATKPTTAVQKKTLYPLFDECFKIPLTPEQRSEENGLVMFIVKDQDFMGMTNEFVSETFVHFKDIPFTQLENDLGSVPQIRLKLTSPKSLDSTILKALDTRSTDKLAKEFLKREKIKIAASNSTPKK
ncbi:protein unc-13 homolog 4B isoform X2 [Rhopalosiphum maidis]|uniref:protein unc-13 homolog 4B isoform X2 n=1 Tax=Rhopalosiphum maidis TaxID=43146 RepID=UPI000EFF9697|nr:protein unc-13 homolog 4B isoform X2 [Rhopalosiphum maidis]